MSIGCGSGVDVYKEGLEYIMRDPDLVYIMKGEIASVGGHGRMIAFALQMTVRRLAACASRAQRATQRRVVAPAERRQRLAPWERRPRHGAKASKPGLRAACGEL